MGDEDYDNKLRAIDAEDDSIISYSELVVERREARQRLAV